MKRRKRSATSESRTSNGKAKPQVLVSREHDRNLDIVDRPALDTLTSSRGKNLVKHLMVVGNTSQFIGEQSSNMTHKWLCYLRVKTKSIMLVEKLVRKVQFHLHSSYKPNDIVDVDKPPFQIIRRGYAEFMIEVLVFFIDEVHKPVKICHHLHLDKKLSGHQSMGRETLCVFWLRDIFGEEIRGTNMEESAVSHCLLDHDYFKMISHSDGFLFR